MLILGLDPGITGAATVFGHPAPGRRPTIVDVFDIPTVGDGPSKRPDICALADWLKSWEITAAYVERAMAMPGGSDDENEGRRKMGSASAFNYGRTFGLQLAPLILSRIPINLTMPAVWKKRFNLSGPNKRDSLDVIIELCPEAAPFFERKKDHNRAESALMAIYGAERHDMISLTPRAA